MFVGPAASRPTGCRGLRKELVDLQPDVVFAMTTPSVKAVLRASRTVPIVFTQVTDPVAQGLIESLNQPGRSLTGITLFEREIGSKLMQVLKEIAPRTTRVAVIFNPDTAPYYKLYMGAIEVAAASFAMKAFEAPAHNRAEIETVLSALIGEPTVGVIPIPDVFTVVNRDLIIALSARYRLPAIYPFHFFVADGGLISYGVDLSDMQRRAAGYVDRILKGAKPTDLPVQLPTKYVLTINLKTAKGARLGRACAAPTARRRGDRIKQTCGCERRDLILTCEYVRSSPRWGVVKSLALIGAGPVGLIHTQKVRIKYKKPPYGSYERNISRRARRYGAGRGARALDILNGKSCLAEAVDKQPSV